MATVDTKGSDADVRPIPEQLQMQPPPGADEDAILRFLEGRTDLPPAPPLDLHEAEAAAKKLTDTAQKEAPELEIKSEAKPAEEPEQPVAESESADDGYERALAALRRYKAPGDVIRNMTREQVVQWGSQIAEMQRATDAAYSDLKELKKQLSKPERTEQAATDHVEAPAQADLSDTTTKLAEILGLAKQDEKILATSLHSLTEPLRKQLEERDTRIQALQQAVTGMLVEQTRRRLEGRIPELGDEPKFQAVIDKTRKLMATGEYDNLTEAMEDAASIVLRTPAGAAGSSQSSPKAQSKPRPTPTPPSPRAAPQSLSQDERESIFLRAVDAGASPEEARARAGW